MISWPTDLALRTFYLVGIKGTGMTAFAELLQSRGCRVSGSDVADVFYTDEILKSLSIPVFQGFSPDNLPRDIDYVIHSSAYDRASHPELLAAQAANLPILEYTEALGAFSAGLDSSGVSGVHGKTSTTAMIGTIIKALDLKASVLVGSGVANFGGHSTWAAGNDFFIAETCEYRRHFLRFHPRRIILTSVEMDHQDYFKDLTDISQAFVEYAQRLPQGGKLIYCCDEAGAKAVAGRVATLRPDIQLLPYGFTADGTWHIALTDSEPETQAFTIRGLVDQRGGPISFRLGVPGRHNILNAAAALALLHDIYTDHYGLPTADTLNAMAEALAEFRGSKRRSEIVGTARGVLFMDDYAHHPTAIRTTLEGFRSFYPNRRIVVDFMSHTYSRTAALLDEFAASFAAADEVILHDIYASAREKYDGSVTGRDLFDKTAAQHPAVHFFPKPTDAADYLRSNLRLGDLFVTMGAGDNWTLGRSLYQEWQEAGV